MTNQPVRNQVLQLPRQEANHIIAGILSVNAVDLLEIVNIHYHNLVGIFRMGIEKQACVMEECLAGIESGLPVKLNFRKHGSGLPHFDQVADSALDAPEVIRLCNKVHSPQL